MSERPIAYVMEQTLGNITHYLNLRRAEPIGDGGPRTWLPIQYLATPLPWTVVGGIFARRALAPVLNDVDGVFIHTTTLAPALTDYFGKKPTILSGDATPMAKRKMRTAYGNASELATLQFAKREVYREVFKRAAGFVAWSNWARQSFIEDYGCNAGDVVVIPPGIDLDLFAPGKRDHELPRLLFVGGDFFRKGGDLLLDVFRKRLRGKAELILVTTANLPPEPGVHVYKNLKANSVELRDLYAGSDVFVLPTRADCYSLVCMEALAAGLPVVTTDVGGLPDVVREGETGHVVPVDDEAMLGDVLSALVTNRGKRECMAALCRADAVARYGARPNARALFEFVRSRC
jgi:glycosyltransferase involved in cell wall biosynthesis